MSAHRRCLHVPLLCVVQSLLLIIQHAELLRQLRSLSIDLFQCSQQMLFRLYFIRHLAPELALLPLRLLLSMDGL